MIIFLLLMAVCLIAILTLTGPIYLLLQKTPFASYTIELAILLFPSFIVLSGSILGHVHARNFNFRCISVALIFGLVTTTLVALYRRALLKSAAKKNAPRIILVSSLALIAGLVVVPRQIAENKLGYLEFMNGEFLNYSQLAVFSMGDQHSSLPSAFLLQHQEGRDGTDFLNVALARLTHAAPVDIVQLTSAFLRLSYCTLCLLIIWEVRVRTVSGTSLAIILLLSLVFSNIDIYSFQVSFMAANAALGVFILLLALLALSGRLSPAPFLAVYSLGNLYLLVTYPEIMPFLKICEAAYFLERSLARAKEKEHIRWTIPLANLVIFLANPSLVLRKIRFVHDLLGANAGWNFLGSPIEDTATYFQRIIGLKYNFVPSQPLIAPLATLGAFLVLAVLLLWGLSCLGRRLNTIVLWLIPLGFLWFHLAPLMAMSNEPKQFYGAAKFILLWVWIAPLSLSIAILELRTLAGRVLLGSSLILLLVCNLVAFKSAVSFQLQLPSFYSSQLRNGMVQAIKSQPNRVIIGSEQTVPLWYWFQVLDSAGLNPVILSSVQANSIARSGNASFSPTSLLFPGEEPTILIQPTKILWFSKLDIIEVEESTSLFNKMTKSNLTVVAGKLISSAPPVELHEALLQAHLNSN